MTVPFPAEVTFTEFRTWRSFCRVLYHPELVGPMLLEGEDALLLEGEMGAVRAHLGPNVCWAADKDARAVLAAWKTDAAPRRLTEAFCAEIAFEAFCAAHGAPVAVAPRALCGAKLPVEPWRRGRVAGDVLVTTLGSEEIMRRGWWFFPMVYPARDMARRTVLAHVNLARRLGKPKHTAEGPVHTEQLRACVEILGHVRREDLAGAPHVVEPTEYPDRRPGFRLSMRKVRPLEHLLEEIRGERETE